MAANAIIRLISDRQLKRILIKNKKTADISAGIKAIN